MPSLQLQTYLRLRAEGCSVATAADEAGIGIDEAWLHEEDIKSGELKLPKGEDVMAKKAQHESDEQDCIEIQKPDFERAIRVLTHCIKPEEEKLADSRGDLSAAWKIIEDECHCNKAATKAFNKLLGMSDEKRDDYLRTLYGLMKTANIGISADLVDKMEDGEAPTMPVTDKRGLGAENLATVN